jgi:general secretion pathway protein G
MQAQQYMRGRYAAPGFTLIELLVVLVILSMLAGLVGPRIMKYVGESKTKTARLQIEELGAAIDLYHLDVGRYPSASQGLQALVEQPVDVESWNGPYLKKNKTPQDPWGFDYHFESPGEHGPYDLYSLGADNAEGGTGENQDINSWE